MISYYPVSLDLRGRLCVIIGGGKIAERKITGMLDQGCKITLISRTATKAIKQWASENRLTWKQQSYKSGDLKGAFLVVAATNSCKTNQAIKEEADNEKTLINVVDEPMLCNFIAPAIIRKGNVTLAISTGGESPALARKIRESLESSEILNYSDLTTILSTARQEVKRRKLEVHPDHWQKCINFDLITMVHEGHEDKALEKLMSDLLNTDGESL